MLNNNHGSESPLTRNLRRNNNTPIQQQPMRQRLQPNTTVLNKIPLNNDKFFCKVGYMEIGGFTIQATNSFSVSLQLCIKHIGNATKLNYIQYGICPEGCYNERFQSIMVFSEVSKNYMIAQNLTYMDTYEADTKLIVWVNLNSANNSNFKFSNIDSKLILNKL